MTWTFDYTGVLAIGSLTIILAGALVYYLGMLFCNRAEMEYGKLGFPERYENFKYYKYGALFLDECLTINIKLVSLFFIGAVFFIFVLLYTNITDNNIFKVIVVILDIFVSIRQLKYIHDNQKEIKISKKSTECNKCEDVIDGDKSCLFQSLWSLVSLIAVSIFITIFYSNSQHDMLTRFFIFTIFVIVPVLLAFLNMSNIAYLHGYYEACKDICEYKKPKKFLVHFIDGEVLYGKKLIYSDGIYTLSKSDILDALEPEYTISEDKVHHVERIYK